jgi:hypothetical protein
MRESTNIVLIVLSTCVRVWRVSAAYFLWVASCLCVCGWGGVFVYVFVCVFV